MTELLGDRMAPENEISRLAREDEARQAAFFDGIPMHGTGVPAATLLVGSWFSRCSACRGNAATDEPAHVHGGPGDTALDQMLGCRAVFVDVDDPMGVITMDSLTAGGAAS